MVSRRPVKPSSNATDAKVLKLFADDEPFWLLNANLLSYDSAAEHEVRNAKK